jgi:hypothetical protein
VPLTLAIGELDADLTAIAALSPSNDDIIQRKAGAWTNRTMAQLVTDLLATGSFLRKATVTLSSAQLLDLNSTSITLVAAPGAGKYLAITRVNAVLTYGTTPYTVADSVPVRVGGVQSVSLASLLGASESSVATMNGGDLTAVPLSSLENGAIDIRASDSNPTGGDSTLTVTVWYSIEDVPA